MTSRSHLIAVLFALAVAQTAAQTPIDPWRAAHERQILDELLGLVAIPNVAGVDADMRRNADHLVALFETAYKQELEVSKQIDALYELAGEQKAYAAMAQREWHINEQVEEEKTMREIVARMNMVKDDPASLLDIDRELGSRVPEAAGGAEAGA